MTHKDQHRQSQKFRDLARELETDESEERFDRALKKVAKAKEKGPKGRPDKES